MLKSVYMFNLTFHRPCESQCYWTSLFTPLMWVNSHRTLWYSRDICNSSFNFFPIPLVRLVSKGTLGTTGPCTLIPLECKAPQSRGLSFLRLQLQWKQLAQSRQPHYYFWIATTVLSGSFQRDCTLCFRIGVDQIKNLVLFWWLLTGTRPLRICCAWGAWRSCP